MTDRWLSESSGRRRSSPRIIRVGIWGSNSALARSVTRLPLYPASGITFSTLAPFYIETAASSRSKYKRFVRGLTQSERMAARGRFPRASDPIVSRPVEPSTIGLTTVVKQVGRKFCPTSLILPPGFDSVTIGFTGAVKEVEGGARSGGGGG